MIQLAKPDFDERELEAVKRVLDSGWVVQGKEVSEFENAIAEFSKSKHCIVVSSGNAALHVCYLSMGIGKGDIIFIPSFAWPSAANMAVLVGAIPVFVDVDPKTYNLDPTDLKKKIVKFKKKKTGKLKAIVVVHEFGLMAEMTDIIKIASENKLEIIEDAACALGATYKGDNVGSFGKMAILSFHPRKAITTGEGGAILTDDDVLANKCRFWRNHGQTIIDGKREFVAPGLNYRLTEIQAAIGKIQMNKFPEIMGKRRKLVSKYYERLIQCDKFYLPEWKDEHTWQTFMIVLKSNIRERIISELRIVGIDVAPGSVAAHCSKYYIENYRYKPDDLPISLNLHQQGLALPLHSKLSLGQVEYCADKLLKTI